MARALYLVIWRKTEFEVLKHRDTIRQQKFMVDFNLPDDYDDDVPAGFIDDYEGLGNFAGKAEARKPKAYRPPKKKGAVQVMATSHGADSTAGYGQGLEF
jgi:hypothetical protein